MIMIDKIKEYIKCPQFGDPEYGEWGALRLEQREAYKYLIDIIEWQEHEISRLTGLIKEIGRYSSEDTPEEPKGIPKKICTNRIINTKDILEFEMIQNKINAEYTYAINWILDYLESKGESNE